MRRVLLWAIAQYQKAFEGRPSPCRFFPSCSEYATDAITLHGAGRGSWLTLRRLARCRPLGPSGYDPVPDPRPAACTHAPADGHRHDHRPGDLPDILSPAPMKVS